jgi:hypothetical protein
MEKSPEEEFEQDRLASVERRQDIREKAEAWAREHWGDDPVCPMCKGTLWSIHEPVALSPMWVPPWPGATFPVCPATCGTCGYTVFISLIMAGILEGRVVDEVLGSDSESDRETA